MKKVLLLCFFLTIPAAALFSQEVIRTTRAAVAETMLTHRESLIRNLENEVQLKRFHNSILICEDEESTDTCAFFSVHEETTLLYLTGKFEQVIKNISAGKDIHQSLRFPKCVTTNACPCASDFYFDSLFVNAVALLKKREGYIRQDIEKSTSLSPDEKKLLVLHLRSVAAYHHLEMFDTETMKTDVDSFRLQNTSPSLSEYAGASLTPAYKTAFIGFGANFEIGYNLLTGGTADYFRSFVGQQINGEISLKNFFIKGGFTFSSGKKLKQGFTYNLLDYTTDSVAFMMGSQLFVGYAVVDNEKIKITPIAGLGNTSISISGNSRNMVFGASWAAGLDADYKFYRYRYYNDYRNVFSNPWNNSCWYIRLRIAWQSLSISDARFEGADLFIGAGIGFYINNAKRKQD